MPKYKHYKRANLFLLIIKQNKNRKNNNKFISDVERVKWKSTLFHFRAEELTQGLIPRRSAVAQSPKLALGLIPFIITLFRLSAQIQLNPKI